MRWQTPTLGRIRVADYFAITGLTLQVAALYSNSWLLVERVEPSRCLPNQKIGLPTSHDCIMTPYKRSEIARAGLWTVCYLFPYVEPPGHTDPYCADFVEDIFQVEGLTMIQMLCTLSTCLTLIGSCLIGAIWFFRCNNAALSSAAFSFLAISGICGLAGCSCIHLYLTKEYIVYYDPNCMVLYKWWAFHVFLDGSIVSLAAWLLNGWINRRYRSDCCENEKSNHSLAHSL